MSGLTQTLYANSAKRTTRKATTRACRMLIKRLLGCWVPLRAGAIHPLWKVRSAIFKERRRSLGKNRTRQRYIRSI